MSKQLPMVSCCEPLAREPLAEPQAIDLATAFKALGGPIEVRSAGSAPADALNPVVVAAMRESGVDISAAKPKVLTPDAIEASDVVITMGCGDSCPVYPGKRYLDWQLDDPAGLELEN